MALNELNFNQDADLDEAIPEIWIRDLIIEAERASFWEKFEGEQGSGMPFIRKDELLNDPGDLIHIQTLANLTGSAVTECNQLQGNEELINLSQIDIAPQLRRHAVAVCVPADWRSNFDFQANLTPRLAYWAAEDKDNRAFTLASIGATYNKFINNRANEAALVAGDELDYTAISQIKTKLVIQNAMKLGGGNNPDYLDSQYCLVIHEIDAYYLRNDTSTLNWNLAQRDANTRGETNPIFSGAMGVLDGMLIKYSDRVPRVLGDTVSRCVAFGGEAFAVGYEALNFLSFQDQDYGNRQGVATGYSCGFARAVEENSLVVHTYADESII